MKTKAVTLALLATLAITPAFAEERPINITEIPQTAKTFIAENFAETEAIVAILDKELFTQTYEVILADGTKIEFDKAGNWKEIICKKKAVPSQLIPQEIASQIAEKYPKALILQIDRDKKKYDIELNNDIELTFNSKYKLTEIEL